MAPTEAVTVTEYSNVYVIRNLVTCIQLLATPDYEYVEHCLEERVKMKNNLI